jgi:hypothetical protein
VAVGTVYCQGLGVLQNLAQGSAQTKARGSLRALVLGPIQMEETLLSSRDKYFFHPSVKDALCCENKYTDCTELPVCPG